jgi:GNAT superfamily N-acetyltransferase
MVAMEKAIEMPIVRSVDIANEPGMVHQISRLLTRCSADFKESRGGHVPDCVVDNIIHRLYTSPSSVRCTFASSAHRFVILSPIDGTLLGTVLIAKSPQTVLVLDSQHLNVACTDHPCVAPPGLHHAFNLAVEKEWRGQGLATTLLRKIATDYRDYFSGKGIWLRAEPPMHDGMLRLGLTHQPAFDQFFASDAILSGGTVDPWEFNRKFLCKCRHDATRIRLMRTLKYKYGVFTIEFDALSQL